MAKALDIGATAVVGGDAYQHRVELHPAWGSRWRAELRRDDGVVLDVKPHLAVERQPAQVALTVSLSGDEVAALETEQPYRLRISNPEVYPDQEFWQEITVYPL